MLSTVTRPDGYTACSLCDAVFRTLAGCRIHQRKAHPNEFHSQVAAAQAAAPPSREWTTDDDCRLWRAFLSLGDLPAPTRNARLVQETGRSFNAIKKRLTFLRKAPPAVTFVGGDADSPDVPDPSSGAASSSSPPPPAFGAVWTVEEERRVWVEYHRLVAAELRAGTLWRRLATFAGRSVSSVTGRVALLRRRGWCAPDPLTFSGSPAGADGSSVVPVRAEASGSPVSATARAVADAGVSPEDLGAARPAEVDGDVVETDGAGGSGARAGGAGDVVRADAVMLAVSASAAVAGPASPGAGAAGATSSPPSSSCGPASVPPTPLPRGVTCVVPFSPTVDESVAVRVCTPARPSRSVLPSSEPARVSPSSSGPSGAWTLADAAVRALEDVADSGLRPLEESVRAGDLQRARQLWGEWAAARFPVLWRPSRAANPRPNRRGRMTARARRRAQYARLQALWASRRKDAAAAALDGSWAELGLDTATVPQTALCDFWDGVLAHPSLPDSRPVPDWGVPEAGCLSIPVTGREVRDALRHMRGSAPGPDRFTPADALSAFGLTLAVVRLLHLLGPAPAFLLGRVTFVPKVARPSTPRDFRPITVGSVHLRVLHKILAARWTRADGVVEPRQFGARPVDGCLGAAGLVGSFLRSAAGAGRPVSAAFLDVSKAFDTVAVGSILRAAEAVGAPPFFLDHLRQVYDSSRVFLPDGRLVSCSRGVRQGDPLSPLLFSAVMREATSALGPGAPSFGGVEVGHVAYADDLVVLATSPTELTARVERLQQRLSAAGLSLNTGKSRALVTRIAAGSRSLFVDASPLPVGSATIPALGPDDSLSYLGVTFGWRGPVPPNHRQALAETLDSLARAPLKPQQRLWTLRNCVVARFLHQLVLGSVHLNTLLAMDRLVRRAARQALHLPGDTPSAFFHASLASGGLGLPAPSVLVPLSKQRRFATLSGSVDPALRAAGAEAVDAPGQRQLFSAPRLDGVPVASSTEAKRRWTELLHSSVDGRGLRDTCPLTTSWLAEPPLRVFGGRFCRAVALRAGVLPCAARAARGRAPTDDTQAINTCRGLCGRSETLQHVIQACSITHGPRVKRHDDLCQALSSAGAGLGFSVTREPMVPAGGTFIKPDLVLLAADRREATVIDVAVASDGSLPRAADLKRDKYGRGDGATAIRRHLTALHPDLTSVTFVPVILSWRGLFLPSTVRALRGAGFSDGFLRHLSWLAVSGSCTTYSQYYRSTFIDR